jgi:hypothetical protein
MKENDLLIYWSQRWLLFEGPEVRPLKLAEWQVEVFEQLIDPKINEIRLYHQRTRNEMEQ